MTAGLVRYDTASGQVRRVRLTDPAVALRWSGGDLYVVTQHAATRVLWRCDDGSCDPLLTDPAGRLELR